MDAEAWFSLLPLAIVIYAVSAVFLSVKDTNPALWRDIYVHYLQPGIILIIIAAFCVVLSN